MCNGVARGRVDKNSQIAGTILATFPAHTGVLQGSQLLWFFEIIFSFFMIRWSFGIVLWEIFTLGGTPYPTVPIEQLMEFLTQGQRMKQPDCCPVEMYAIMRRCWDPCPEQRPNFAEISQIIRQIFDEYVAEVS